MKMRISKWTISLAAAALVCPVAIHAQTTGAQTTLTGVVSDTMCGATHMSKTMSAADCTRACVKAGEKYALVVDKKLYVLQGHEAEFDKLAAQTVTVKGTLKGNTVAVASVSPAK